MRSTHKWPTQSLEPKEYCSKTQKRIGSPYKENSHARACGWSGTEQRHS
jgi:hypothetical protein